MLRTRSALFLLAFGPTVALAAPPPPATAPNAAAPGTLAPPPAGTTAPVGNPPVPAAPGAQVPGQTATPSAPPPASSSGTSATPATPPLPNVTDPMLEPPPAPARILNSWRDALRLVRSRSTELRRSVAEVTRASAQAESVLARAYPSLTATGNLQQHLLLGKGNSFTAEGLQTNVDIPDPSTQFNARLALRHPLIDYSAWQDVKTARATQFAAQERIDNVERLLLATVADTIVSVVTAERLAEVSRIALHSSLSTLTLTRRRAELGASSSVDVLRAEQEVAFNRTQVVASNEALRRSREALGLALGYSEAWGLTPEIRLNELGQDAAQVCAPVGDLQQRADLRAAQADVEVARKASDASQYRLAPQLDFLSDLTYATGPNTANGRPIQWTVGALLTVPLYDGGARNAEVRQNSAQVEIAQQNLTQVRRQAELEVLQANRGVQVAQQNYELSFQSRELSRETARLAQLSFLNGKGTSFELVDAARRHQQAELDLTVKEFEVVRARITALLANANCDL